MRIIIKKNSTISNLIEKDLTESELRSVTKVYAFGSRIGLYGFPIVMVVACFFAQPLSFQIQFNSPIISFPLYAFLILIITPIVHELIHLVSLPSKIFLSDTLFIVHLNGFKTNLAVRPGGFVTDSQFIFSSLAPFTLLTAIPFALIYWNYTHSFWLVYLASYNFYLSGIDLVQAAVLVFSGWRRKRSGGF